MPKAVIGLGAVQHIFPIQAIGEAVNHRILKKGEIPLHYGKCAKLEKILNPR
jgi:hypothetical protein